MGRNPGYMPVTSLRLVFTVHITLSLEIFNQKPPFRTRITLNNPGLCWIVGSNYATGMFKETYPCHRSASVHYLDAGLQPINLFAQTFIILYVVALCNWLLGHDEMVPPSQQLIGDNCNLLPEYLPKIVMRV